MTDPSDDINNGYIQKLECLGDLSNIDCRTINLNLQDVKHYTFTVNVETTSTITGYSPEISVTVCDAMVSS